MKSLDRFEREILGSYEKGVLVSAHPTKAQLASFREAARATFVKNKRVNIRLSASDFFRRFDTVRVILHPSSNALPSNRPRRLSLRSSVRETAFFFMPRPLSMQSTCKLARASINTAINLYQSRYRLTRSRQKD
jgi:hypothetical protein